MINQVVFVQYSHMIIFIIQIKILIYLFISLKVKLLLNKMMTPLL